MSTEASFAEAPEPRPAAPRSATRATGGADTPPQPARADGAAAPAPMALGDDAPPGTPGTDEDVCPQCGGRGKVNKAIGGA